MSQSTQIDKSWSKWHMRLHKRLKQNKSLLPSNSTILLAISGGQDSMALLKLIIDLKRLYKWQIEIWHGDHQWHNQSKKIKEELKYTKGFLQSVQKKLANERFVANAPEKVIEIERKKQTDAEAKIETLEKSLANLE